MIDDRKYRKTRHALGAALGCALLASVALAGPRRAPAPDHVNSPGPPRDSTSVTFFADPIVIDVATIGAQFESAALSDLGVADFDGDGHADIAVAWYATDLQIPTSNLRFLTLYYGDGSGGFVRGNEFNLYVRDPIVFQRSIFANGTALLAIGDFDGDNDPDIAVTAYFGDEIWFIENRGNRQYTPRSKHVFGVNSAGNSITPPDAVVADFDGDGRVDLAYITDPILRVNLVMIAFWRTTSTMSAIVRVPWEGVEFGPTVLYTRGMATADFDADGRADLVFSGTTDIAQELDPILVFWYGLNTATNQFSAHSELPPFICGDVAVADFNGLCDASVVLSDRDGSQIQLWDSNCASGVDYHVGANETGFAETSINRGMTTVCADVNADGIPDIVTRQRIGSVIDCNRVEIALGAAGLTDWIRLPANTLNTCGFTDPANNAILRPRALAVADVMWSPLPEIIAGFGPSPTEEGGLGVLQVAIWQNSCRADVNFDGMTDVADLSTMLGAMGCEGGPEYDPLADLDHNGCIDIGDLSLLLSDYGCDCCSH